MTTIIYADPSKFRPSERGGRHERPDLDELVNRLVQDKVVFLESPANRKPENFRSTVLDILQRRGVKASSSMSHDRTIIKFTFVRLIRK